MSDMAHRYFVLNKPYNMVSQFVSSHKVELLGDLGADLPEGIHAVGRLDRETEGLLLLTTNKNITRLLFESGKPHKRTYLILVNGKISEENLQKLREGVYFRVRGGGYYRSMPCEVESIEDPQLGFSSPVPIPEKAVYSWICLRIAEGKFHQVRKMIFAVKHRCRRLVRVKIEDLALGNLAPGQIRELSEAEFFSQLKIGVPGQVPA